ncbi:MAG: precorrin-3B C(17)-methyltransferase, partial [Lachnospiraceae bacterium]|nr:precorrin-3B C(17)-methyltransferase [Lachnospiraceae bacterium]
ADEGHTVSLICSGDPGVYGMAGLVLDMAEEFPEVEIEVISGVTAAMSGAALLGAPLIHDFAVISLSDRLTPWDKIEKRLRAAADADLCIVLYNPSSRGRKEHLHRAAKILLESLPPYQVCGIADRIGREGQRTRVMTLEELTEAETDMFSTVFIGNSSTKRVGDKIVTPRGYHTEKGVIHE